MSVACQGAALGITPSPWETLARCELNSGTLIPRTLQIPKRNTRGLVFDSKHLGIDNGWTEVEREYLLMFSWIDADWGGDGMGDCVRGDQ